MGLVFVEDNQRRRLTWAEPYGDNVSAKLGALLSVHPVVGERQTMIARLIGALEGAQRTMARYPSI